MLVTLMSRAGCHLCDVAREIAVRVIGETGDTLEIVDVDADLETRAEYGDRVPVVLIDGAEHGYFSIDETRLRAALTSGSTH
ncbi:glutaredoxin family protein [Nakamurella silvestris]|nr:glutaredoxin family protein [Nakamurella silvestris]